MPIANIYYGKETGDAERLCTLLHKGGSLAGLIDTAQEALMDYTGRATALELRHLKGELDALEFLDDRLLLLEEYEGRISTRDIYLFETEEGILDFLRKIGCREDNLKRYLEMEKPHFEKSKELGHLQVYACWLGKHSLGDGRVAIGYLPFVLHAAVDMKPSDLASIVGAVDEEHQSDSDREILKRLQE